jgi:hypothetical protein
MVEATTDTLDATYNLSTHAKRYRDLGTENYRKGKKTTAKANSNKKKALYAVKEHVLMALLDAGEADRVERHRINDQPFWCVYFTDSEGEQWSYHSPTDVLAIDEGRHPVSDEPERELEDFESNGEKERSDKSLKESLLHIESEFGVNANEHLPGQYLYYGHKRYFIGWKYLGESGPERETEQETLA